MTMKLMNTLVTLTFFCHNSPVFIFECIKRLFKCDITLIGGRGYLHIYVRLSLMISHLRHKLYLLNFGLGKNKMKEICDYTERRIKILSRSVGNGEMGPWNVLKKIHVLSEVQI